MSNIHLISLKSKQLSSWYSGDPFYMIRETICSTKTYETAKSHCERLLAFIEVDPHYQSLIVAGLTCVIETKLWNM